MHAYGLNLDEVLAWTYPQLRLMRQYRDQRERDEKRWELMLATGTLAPEMLDTLWQSIGGEPLNIESKPVPVPATQYKAGSLDVDENGNVVAPPGAPLLSDIAQGKATAPSMIPITVAKRTDDGSERSPPTPTGD